MAAPLPVYLRGAPRPPASPHGVAVGAAFFAHDARTSAYAAASQVKTLDVHPALPWVATADEAGNVCVWDYASESVVVGFPAESVKEQQRENAEAEASESERAGNHDRGWVDAQE